jgi:hypothetical protein
MVEGVDDLDVDVDVDVVVVVVEPRILVFSVDVAVAISVAVSVSVAVKDRTVARSACPSGVLGSSSFVGSSTTGFKISYTVL